MSDHYKLQNGTIVFTDEKEHPSMAAFILGYFSMRNKNKRVLELCSSSGAVSFWRYDRGFTGHTVMVDLRPEQLELAQKTAAENSFDIEICCMDAEIYRGEKKFDVIICNPPFFDELNRSTDPDRNAIRHENGFSLDALFNTAALNIKQKGHMYLCHLPDRLPDLFEKMRSAGFEPKTIRFCRHSQDRLPFIVLVDTVYKGGKKLTVEPDLNVFDPHGNYTEEMIEICERGYI